MVKKQLIIGLSGYPQVGKTTCALHLSNKLGYYPLSFATNLKNSVDVMFPHLLEKKIASGKSELPKDEIDPVTHITYRQILQIVGTQVARQIHEDVWVMALQNRINAIFEDDEDAIIVIDDVRFPNEAKIVDYLVSIDRDGVCYNEHESNKHVPALKKQSHYNIHNNGSIGSYENAIEQMIKHMKKAGVIK